MEHEWLPEENLEENICFCDLPMQLLLDGPQNVLIECKHHDYNEILKSRFLSVLSYILPRRSRSSDKLRLPSLKLECTKKTFFIMAV